jgi:hypothetical protein
MAGLFGRIAGWPMLVPESIKAVGNFHWRK